MKQRYLIYTFAFSVFLIMVFCPYQIFSKNKYLKPSNDPDEPPKFTKRYYYDFSQKKLLEDKNSSKEIFRPINYKANKDISIEVFNYNPLKEEIIIEGSSSQYFMEDTAKFAKFIILPSITKSEETDFLKDTISYLGIEREKKSIGYSLQEIGPLEDKLEKYNNKRNQIRNSIKKYKEFLIRIEPINDVLNYLKGKQVLIGDDIINTLETMVLKDLKSFLGNEDELGTTVNYVSHSNLINYENIFFTDIISGKNELKIIKEEINKLECASCSNENKNKFIGLITEINIAFNEEIEYLKRFENTHVEKILPAFTKTMLVYNNLLSLSNGIPIFVTKAVTIDKDVHAIKIYQKTPGTETKTEYDVINIEPIRGWKIDVGSGIFVSGLYDEHYTKKSYDSIYTKQYLLNGKVRDTTVQGNFSAIYEKSELKASLGGMIYMHAHSQNPSLFNYGFSLGMGALFNDNTRLAGSASGTLIIGKKQRFTVNLGVVAAQVSRLDKPYETEKYYLEPLDNIPTSQVLKCSWMAGFSWNFK
jgi:hypothetical protein